MVIFKKRKRRKEMAEFLHLLLQKHPSERIYLVWDNVYTHKDYEIEEIVRAEAGRLVLLYLPTYSPWLNPVEMLWRYFRREVTHCELFVSVKKLLEASEIFFEQYNLMPKKILSVIGSNALNRHNFLSCT